MGDQSKSQAEGSKEKTAENSQSAPFDLAKIFSDPVFQAMLADAVGKIMTDAASAEDEGERITADINLILSTDTFIAACQRNAEIKVQAMAASGELLQAHATAQAAREAQEQAELDAEVTRNAENAARAEKRRHKTEEAAREARAREAEAKEKSAVSDYQAVRALAGLDLPTAATTTTDDRAAAELDLRNEGGTIRLADGSRFLPFDAAIAVEPDQLSWQGGRVIFNGDIAPLVDQPPEVATEVWLFSKDAALRCDIPGGVPVGGGRSALLRAGSLIF